MLLLITIMVFFANLVLAQSSVVIVHPEGKKFRVFLDGSLQNEIPESSVSIKNIYQNPATIKIQFADQESSEVEQKLVTLGPDKHFTDSKYIISKNSHGNDTLISEFSKPITDISQQESNARTNRTIGNKPYQVSGTVFTAEDGKSLPGATVSVVGTKTGTITDVFGKYTLTVPSGNSRLEFSFVGYQPQIVDVSGKTVIDVKLAPSVTNLNEVVVTALGIKREKKALGYAVQEVSGNDLQTVKDASFVNQLSGKVAGLNITSTTGGPASSSRIVLRGNKSLGGNNQALIVVDGVPIENTTINQTNQWGGRDYGNGISDINPDDIESVSVLKGANASALYGSKAINGVLVITTKKGAANKGVGVSFNSSTTFESATNVLKFQDKYGAGRNGKFEGPWDMVNGIPTYNTNSASAYGSWGPKMEGQTIRDWDGKLKTFDPQPGNYLDFYKVGTTTTNSVSLDGGNDKITYRFSFADMRNTDIVPGTKVNRNNIGIRSTAKITNRLTIDGSFTYTLQKANNRLALSNSYSVPRNYIMMPRNISNESLENNIMDEYGKEQVWYTNWNWMSNPYWDYRYELNDDSRDRFLGILSATYTFSDKLSLMIRGNRDFNLCRYNAREAYNGVSNSLGSYSSDWKKEYLDNADALFSWNDSIGKDIAYNVNLGGSVYQRNYEKAGLSTSNGLSLPYWYNVMYSNNTPILSSYLEEKRISSVYSFGQVAYKGWLYFDVTARNDWSSTLPRNNNSYFYPSLSTGFVFSQAFNLEGKKFTYGKVRASWAQVGNDANPYSLQKAYYSPTPTSYNGSPMIYLYQTVPNYNLKPEIASSLEFGAELYFFMSRVSVDFTYYKTNTRNQILATNISNASGSNQAIINSGEIENKGIEIQLRTTPIKRKNSFTWNCNFNYAHNTSMVVSLAEGLESYQLLEHWRLSIEARPGHSYGDIVGYGIQRDENGNKLVDENGMYIRDESPRVLGNINPKFTGGISNTFTYKGLSLSFLIDVRVGGQMFSGTNMYGCGYSGNLEQTLEGRDEWYASEAAREAAGVSADDWVATGGVLAEGVTADGKPNTVYVNPEKYWGQFSSWLKEIHEPFVYNSGFVKLRELSIGYNIPQKLISKWKIKGMYVSFVGRNLWLIHSDVPNVDPESAYTNGNGQGYEIYSYPTRKSMGINIKFNF